MDFALYQDGTLIGTSGDQCFSTDCSKYTIPVIATIESLNNTHVLELKGKTDGNVDVTVIGYVITCQQNYQRSSLEIVVGMVGFDGNEVYLMGDCTNEVCVDGTITLITGST